MNPRILAAGLACLALQFPTRATAAPWTTPDGRYGAAFPSSPEPMPLGDTGPLKVVGWQHFPREGDIVHRILTVRSSPDVRRMPLSIEMEMAALGGPSGVPIAAETRAFDFVGVGLATVSTIALTLEGQSTIKRAVIVIDGTNAVRLTVTRLKSESGAHRAEDEAFLRSLTIRGKTSAWHASVATAAPAPAPMKGFRRWRATGHPKALGLDFGMQVPENWTAKEGERPHVLQTFSTLIRDAYASLHVLVNDLPVAPDLSADSFTQASLQEAAKDAGFTFIEGGPTRLEGEPAGWCIQTRMAERVGNRMYFKSYTLLTVHRGKLLRFDCQLLAPEPSRAEVDRGFVKLLPLCKQIVNSVVFADRWNH